MRESKSTLVPKDYSTNRFEALQRRIDQIRIEGESRDHEHRKRRRRRRERHDDGDPRAEDHGGMRREETHVESVKVKVPQFVGLNNPEAYLKWELKIKQLFEYHNYSKEKKVKVAASEFKEYAMVWWDQYQKDRRRCGAKLIDTWEDMKDVMRRRYAPNSYKKGNPNKLQSRPKFIQKKFEQTDFSKELKRVLEKCDTTRRERKHERSEKKNMSETLVEKKELSEKQREGKENTLSENKSEELCIEFNFLDETLVHNGIHEISKDTPQILQPIEEFETMEPIPDPPKIFQPCLESPINSEYMCFKNRLGNDWPLQSSDQQLSQWHYPKTRGNEWNELLENKKPTSALLVKPNINCLDRNFHYFVVSVTPFRISTMEPNENMFLSQALHPLRKNLLHTISSHHASLHFFRTNIYNVFVDSNCIFLKLHGGPRSSLIKQDEGKSQEGDIKCGFVRRVFDPGGLDRT
ncbi:hypothetical protein Lal_00042144 [Lupinus albus]|nr:hypothetical protein Lal_00042144 [Lupinus albus]